ncbi:MAG: hypothetical protein Kow0063_38670 [Anaerolineae bacterium]
MKWGFRRSRNFGDYSHLNAKAQRRRDAEKDTKNLCDPAALRWEILPPHDMWTITKEIDLTTRRVRANISDLR